MNRFLFRTFLIFGGIFIITAIGINKYAKGEKITISTGKLSKKETAKSLLYADTSGLFDPIPNPKPGDWLDSHEEPGQTLKQFLRQKRNIPEKSRSIIYLQPLWIDDTGPAPALKKLKKFTEAYFMMPVIVAKPLNPPKKDFEQRFNKLSQTEQVHAGLILEYLKKHIPKDAFCVQAITMIDLYPDPTWNFVFGYASYLDRVGVFSFARYNPLPDCDTLPKPFRRLLFLRSCKVLGHETGHMFKMAHCIYYHCQMNGSNHLNESDAQPIHLCPVCLAKLQNSVQFNPVERYQKLLRFYQDAGLIKELGWVKRRLSKIDNL